MQQSEIMCLILDNWPKPVVFVDNQHIIRYLNEPAKKTFSKYGDLIGKSIFACHNERSCEIIREVYSQFENGLDEKFIYENEKHRAYMRSVRDKNGRLIGYFERYEIPDNDVHDNI